MNLKKYQYQNIYGTSKSMNLQYQPGKDQSLYNHRFLHLINTNINTNTCLTKLLNAQTHKL